VPTTGKTTEHNKELCAKYPWLIPTNRWSGKRITDGAGYWPGTPDIVPEWDYENTELDEMPEGWRIAFGEQMCEELQRELEAAGRVDTYRITQIKEKFGWLHWYDYGGTVETDSIIHKYADISQRTCIKCGRPARFVTIGWISPYCEDCVPLNETSISLEEWLADEE